MVKFEKKNSIYNENTESFDVGGKHSHAGKYTLPSFDIKKVLDLDIDPIVVDKIPKEITIEHTPVFRLFLHHFNKAYGTKLSPEELLYSRSSFNGFMNFILMCSIKRYIIIDRARENDFMLRIQELYDRYAENLRSLERYYSEIIRTVYQPRGFSKKEKWVRDEMDHFEQAYTLIKAVFQNDFRESGDRTFEHPKGVMEICLRELPNPNIQKTILALLHDIQETFPEYADVIRKVYGDYIADSVNNLSKKDWKLYLTEDEKRECEPYLKEQEELFAKMRQVLIKQHAEMAFTSADKFQEADIIGVMSDEELARHKMLKVKIKPFMLPAKDRRDDDYFGHLDELDDNCLDVKFADRIHNLRDNSGVGKRKKARTVDITKKYFLEIAKRRNPIAYQLMMDEINEFETSIK